MISDVGTVGTNVVYNNTNTVTVTVDRDIPIGAVLVCWLATNSIHGFSDRTAQGWMFAYDTKGNIYCSLASAENGVTFYFQGAMGQILITQVYRALEAGDVITFWLAQPDSGPDTTVKAVSIREFDFDGLAWAASGESWAEAKALTAADPASLGKDLGSVQDWLCLHALCSEGPDTDTYTWDSDYTQIAGTGATGTGVDVHVRGGFAIVTGTAFCPTVDVSSTTDRRHIQLLAGICGKRPRSFPEGSLPLIDAFNRANENPLDGGIWNPYPSSYGFNKAQIVSNRLEGNGGSQTLATYDGKCQGVYATMADDGTYPTSQVISLGVTGDSSLATFLGHVAVWEQYQEYFSGSRPLSLSYGREFGVSAIRPPLWANVNPADGYRWGILLRRPEGDEGFITSLWVDLNNGDGWRTPGAIVWRDDFPYPEGALGAGVGQASNGAIENFHGGDIPCGDFRPQVYRRPFVV